MIQRINMDLLRYRGLLWSRATARKATKCWLTRAEIVKGDDIYRPITNGNNRMQRLKASEVDRILGA